MSEIICPFCRVRIPIYRDLRAMAKTIEEHVECHVKKNEELQLPSRQIKCLKEELEEALAEEVLKEVAKNTDDNSGILIPRRKRK
jgi:hypothetical protein